MQKNHDKYWSNYQLSFQVHTHEDPEDCGHEIEIHFGKKKKSNRSVEVSKQ